MVKVHHVRRCGITEKLPIVGGGQTFGRASASTSSAESVVSLVNTPSHEFVNCDAVGEVVGMRAQCRNEGIQGE